MNNCENCSKNDVCKFREDMEAANDQISKVVEKSCLNVTCELKCGYFLNSETVVIRSEPGIQSDPYYPPPIVNPLRAYTWCSAGSPNFPVL